jgi:predicted CopG family antitoxin
MKMIIENKVKLIDWLRADSGFILQHVHSKRIVTDREYQELKSISVPEAAVTDLIDKMILKKEETCSQFLDTLKESEVKDTYPELKKWITTTF